MQGISTFSWYPRGALGLQNLGPSVAHGFITAGLPNRIVNGPGAAKMTKPTSNNFEFNSNTIKDSIGFKVSEPERIIHPNLKPTVNFSLPTTSKRLDALSLREDVNKDTADLDGQDLLGKLTTYVLDLYRQGSSPFELTASPFQSLVSACKRLNLNIDPVLAGLPRTIDQRTTMGTFVKVNIWLLGAPQNLDKSLKPGYIYVAQNMVPVSFLVGPNKPAAFLLDVANRRASVGVANVSLADIAEGPRLPNVGLAAQGGPNLADGRDGKQNVANQQPNVPFVVEEVKALEKTKEAVNEAAALQGAIDALSRPQSLKYTYVDPYAQREEQDPYADLPELQQPDPLEKVVKQVVAEEVKEEAKVEPAPSAEEVYEREQAVLLGIRERLSTEMLKAPGDPWLSVFRFYAQDKDDEAKLKIGEIFSEPGATEAYPTLLWLREKFQRDFNQFVEVLGDIRRNGYRDRFVSPTSRQRLDTEIIKRETYKFLSGSPSWQAILTGRFTPTTQAGMQKQLNLLAQENPYVWHYLDSRSQYTASDKWNSLRKLWFSKGQKGFGRNRKATRKAPRKATRKAKKRHNPY